MSFDEERIMKFAESALSKVRVSSALNVILAICALIVPAGIYGIVKTEGNAQVALIVLTFIPVILFSVGFIYFMINDPAKLRSEDYELRMEALALIEEKGGKITLESVQLAGITNPKQAQLPESGKTAHVIE